MTGPRFGNWFAVFLCLSFVLLNVGITVRKFIIFFSNLQKTAPAPPDVESVASEHTSEVSKPLSHRASSNATPQPTSRLSSNKNKNYWYYLFMNNDQFCCHISNLIQAVSSVGWLFADGVGKHTTKFTTITNFFFALTCK